ncbi:MAG: DUF6502 family protein [Gammaproteobacteria bacterium]|nr:DUF6502 family protein [Gammaproteobacteria bacterium]
MSKETKSAALLALRLLMRPIIRIVLRSGITYLEAIEVCKMTFVEVARQDYGIAGRPTNASRVAIMTGLSRREVSRITQLLQHENTDTDLGKMNDATRVLTGWHVDPGFLSKTGRPRLLEFDEDTSSFSALSKKYASDIPPSAMLKELTRVGAVKETKNGKLQVLMRQYMLSDMNPDAILRSGSVLADLGETVNFNLSRVDKDVAQFEGRATNIYIGLRAAKTFRSFLEKEGQAFLERVDNWLSNHELTDEKRKKEKTIRMGVGLYQVRDHSH